VKKNRKGHYMLLGINAPAPAMQEVVRQLGLNEDVLRELTIRVEEIDPEAPSAILAKRADDRDRERGFRGPKPAGRFGSGRAGAGGRDDREEYRARPRDEMDLNLNDEM